LKSYAARLIAWFVAVVLSLAGMWVSWSLALEYYRVSTAGDSLLGGVCSAAAEAFKGASCEKVSQSRWGWFPPLPDTSDKAEKHDADDQDKHEKPGKGTDDPFATGKDAQSAGQEAAKQDKPKQEASAQTTSKSKDQDKVHPGVPTGQLGLMYFTFAFCWLLFASPVKANRVWPHVILLLASILGVLGSAGFEFIMWTQMETWCPLCVIAHAISLLILILVVLLWPRRKDAPVAEPAVIAAVPVSEPSTGLFTPIPEPAAPVAVASVWPTSRVVLMAVVMALVMMVGQHFHIMKAGVNRDLVVAKYYRETYEKKFNQYDRYWMHNYYAWALSPQLNIPIEGRATFGRADAPHTLVLFSDFECPSCSRLAAYIHDSVIPMSKKLPNGDFRMIFKHWPIGKDCNEAAKNNLHPKACQASYAAEAARLVGGDEAFWKMHDLLFANQHKWKKTGEFVEYAKQIGLDETEFIKAMNSSEAIARIRQDVQDGIELGKQLTDPTLAGEMKVDSTPVLFIDGRKLSNPTRWQTWRAILQSQPTQPKEAGTQQGLQQRQGPGPRHGQASQPSIRIQLGK